MCSFLDVRYLGRVTVLLLNLRLSILMIKRGKVKDTLAICSIALKDQERGILLEDL